MFCLLCEHLIPSGRYDLCIFLYEMCIKLFTLKKTISVGEVARRLRMMACSSRDLGWVPSTYCGAAHNGLGMGCHLVGSTGTHVHILINTKIK